MSNEILTAAARSLRNAQRVFDDHWLAWFNAQPVLAQSKFWRMIDALRAEVINFRFGLKRSNGIEHACEEFMRKALVGRADYTLDEAIRFARTYEQAVERLRARYGGGCDSRNDLLDAMPLCGKACLSFTPNAEISELQMQIEAVFHDATFARAADVMKLTRLICEGENYIAMRICEAAKQVWLADSARKEATS